MIYPELPHVLAFIRSEKKVKELLRSYQVRPSFKGQLTDPFGPLVEICLETTASPQDIENIILILVESGWNLETSLNHKIIAYFDQSNN